MQINPIIVFTGNPQKTEGVLKDPKYEDRIFYVSREKEPLDKFYRRVSKDPEMDITQVKMIAEISSRRNPVTSIRRLAELQTEEILKNFPMISAGNIIVFPSIFKTDRSAFAKGAENAGAIARTSLKRALNYAMIQTPPYQKNIQNQFNQKRENN